MRAVNRGEPIALPSPFFLLPMAPLGASPNYLRPWIAPGKGQCFDVDVLISFPVEFIADQPVVFTEKEKGNP